MAEDVQVAVELLQPLGPDVAVAANNKREAEQILNYLATLEVGEDEPIGSWLDDVPDAKLATHGSTTYEVTWPRSALPTGSLLRPKSAIPIKAMPEKPPEVARSSWEPPPSMEEQWQDVVRPTSSRDEGEAFPE